MDYLTGMAYSRTLSDVSSGNSKGFWNISDLNRIESKIKEIADYIGLTSNYKVWSIGDLISLSDINLIFDDLNNLKSHWHTADNTPATPSVNNFNYQSANDMEKIISDMYDFMLSVQKDFIYCGTRYSGGLLI